MGTGQSRDSKADRIFRYSDLRLAEVLMSSVSHEGQTSTEGRATRFRVPPEPGRFHRL